MTAQHKPSGATLGPEETLRQAADKLRGYMDPGEYKHVVLGLIFLKDISDAFEEHRAALGNTQHADLDSRDEYTAESIFWAPRPACWESLRASAKQPTVRRLAVGMVY